jgi:hypothetical protein
VVGRGDGQVPAVVEAREVRLECRVPTVGLGRKQRRAARSPFA